MWLLLFLCVHSLAKVFVLSPTSLKTEMQSRNPGLGEVRSSLGNFGNPPYGTSIIGRVFYDDKNAYACSPVTLSFASEPDTVSVPMLMAKRGECTFAMKARWAENAGAKALLVVDNIDELVEYVVMSDSGNGGDLQIPSFLLSKRDGEEILRYVHMNYEEVILKLHFEVLKNQQVHLQIWFSPNEKRSNSFLADFSPYGRKFSPSRLIFTPHYALWNCRECADSGFSLPHPDCISGGRYCGPDPDGLGPYTGRDVILEDIRELCVFEQSLSKHTYALWMDYMREYNQTCVSAEDFSEKCSFRVMKSVKVDIKSMVTCFNKSFMGDKVEIHDNSLMKREKVSWNEVSAGLYPTLLVNNEMYRGDWEGLHVARTVCASFYDPPDMCSDLDEIEPPSLPAESSISTSLVILIIALLLLFIAAVLAGYRIYLKRELKQTMSQQVNVAVSQYRALGGEAEMGERYR